jgi:beta-galactosidase/beta-glucuronidase
MIQRVEFSPLPHASWNQFPRPGEVRAGELQQWESLNGQMELSLSRVRRPDLNPQNIDYDRQVVVPYAVGSYLSGVEEAGVLLDLAYRKEFVLPDEWLTNDQRIFLHIDGADYRSVMRVNNSGPLIEHRGGYTPFRAEVTGEVRAGENTMYLHVVDDMADPLQPKGKQSMLLYERGCMYTPMAGINGPVWLQSLPSTFIDRREYFPSFANGEVGVNLRLDGDTEGLRVETIISADGKVIATRGGLAGERVAQELQLGEVIPYDPINEVSAFRYDIEHVLYQRGGKEVDHVTSRFGLRDIGVKDGKISVNGKPISQYAQILYQGFHPESLYIPPNLERTEEHVRAIKAMGFDGIRYHQNVPHPLEMEIFEREGLLVALEYADWGPERSHPLHGEVIAREVGEAVDLYGNSPAVHIVCGLNETQREITKQDKELVGTVYTRIKRKVGNKFHVKAVSGFSKRKKDPTDIESHHFYARSEAGLRRSLRKPLASRNGRPVFLDEFGGIATEVIGIENDRVGFGSGKRWAYGAAPKNSEAAFKRLRELMEVVREVDVDGFCYTQFNHTGPELNGLADAYGNPIFPIDAIQEVVKGTAGGTFEEITTQAAD